MKNIGKHVKRLAIAGGAIGALYLGALSLNQSNNKELKKESYYSIRKADGAFGYTQYTHFYFGMDTVHQRRYFTFKNIVDGGVFGKNDGLVDKMSVSSSIEQWFEPLCRKTAYDTHKDEFDEADKLLAETKERFKDYLTKTGDE